MSSTPPDSGKTIVFAYATAKEGKADELQKLIAEARASAESDKEPYTLTYRTSRHGDTFAIFEEYDQDVGADGLKGIEAHKAQPPFQNLVKSGLVADIDIKFYQEFK
ncbi:putative quinol monooxygenase [Sporobolomyces salmoneus]|uniref:putative quinol monooxygenase n=1 Tax=Sporobolomyces salmoneus TaxID=183962 RepID=UPI00317055DB